MVTDTARGSSNEPSRHKPIRRLRQYAAPHWRVLVLGGALTLAGGAASLSQPLLARHVIDALSDGTSAVRPVLFLAAIILGGAVLAALGAYCLERTGQSVVLGVRRTLVGALLRLRVGEVDRLKPGDLVSRLTADTTLLRSAVTNGIVNIITSAVLLTGGIVIMFVLDWRLSLVAAGLVASVGLLMTLIMPRIRAATEASQAALGEMGSRLERIFGAFRTVKASSAEERETARLDEAAVRSWRYGVAVAGWTAVSGTTTSLAANIALLGILAVGGGLVATGAMELSVLIAFLLLLFYLIQPISGLVSSLAQLQTGLAAVGRIDEVTVLEGEAVGGPEAVERPGSAPACLELSDVTFRYRPDLPDVHRGISFRAAGTGLTALVGPSGSGKTTVFSLIERFYHPTSGAVLLDGTDVRTWPLDLLRAQIGYVEQDAPVLDGTLRENLVMAAPHADEAAVAHVVRRARLEDLVARLPRGLDSEIGHRGVTISGGERQRVAIARALLRAPRLLLMDEATSQLDAANEAALKEAMAEASRTTNVIVVAHRLSTVTSAEQIVVMDAGKVRAMGTHAELLDTDPLYRDLAVGQLLASDRT